MKQGKSILKEKRDSMKNKGTLVLHDWVNAIQNEINHRMSLSRNHIMVAVALSALTALLAEFMIINELKMMWIYFLAMTTTTSIITLAVFSSLLKEQKKSNYKIVLIVVIPWFIVALIFSYLSGPILLSDVLHGGIFIFGGLGISFALALCIGSVIYLYSITAVLQKFLIKILSSKTFSHSQISKWHEEILNYSPLDLYSVSVGKAHLPWDKPSRLT